MMIDSFLSIRIHRKHRKSNKDMEEIICGILNTEGYITRFARVIGWVGLLSVICNR